MGIARLIGPCGPEFVEIICTLRRADFRQERWIVLRKSALVSILIRFVRTVLVDANVTGLFVGQLCELRTELGEL